jgi:hypothetical protein
MHNTIQSIVNYGTLFTLVLGVCSLALGTIIYRRQMNAQIFFEIASGYRDLQQALPQVLRARLYPSQALPQPSEEVTVYVLRYLLNAFFAFTLHRRKYLSNDLWKILQLEHQRTFSTPLFAREWNVVKAEFEIYPRFIAYVDSLRSSNVSDRVGTDAA